MDVITSLLRNVPAGKSQNFTKMNNDSAMKFEYIFFEENTIEKRKGLILPIITWPVQWRAGISIARGCKQTTALSTIASGEIGNIYQTRVI